MGEMIEVPGTQSIKGLVFRRFAGESDFSVMTQVGQKSYAADGIDYIETADDLRNEYSVSPNRDALSELLFAEMGGKPVAYARIWLDPGSKGEITFWHSVQILPELRNTTLRRAMFRYDESQITKMAKSRGSSGQIPIKLWSLEDPSDWRDLVLSEGYRPVLHFYEMIRPNLQGVPDVSLPKGLELRPVRPNEYRKIWDASREAFRGKPWFLEEYYSEEYFEAWQHSPSFTPDLWLVAWDGDDVAGMARNEIPADQNMEFHRSRGHTQHLSVMPKWRRKGLGRALLAASLALMREKGLNEADLDVETQSTTGELDLYLSMGYKVTKRYAHFQKLVAVSSPSAASASSS